MISTILRRTAGCILALAVLVGVAHGVTTGRFGVVAGVEDVGFYEFIDGWSFPGEPVLAVEQFWGRRFGIDGLRLKQGLAVTAAADALGRPGVAGAVAATLPFARHSAATAGVSAGVGFPPEQVTWSTAVSAGVVVNGNDRDFLVGPGELFYDGPGFAASAGYGVRRGPGDSRNSSLLVGDASAQWTHWLRRVGVEAGPGLAVRATRPAGGPAGETWRPGLRLACYTGHRPADLFRFADEYLDARPGFEAQVEGWYSLAHRHSGDTLDEWHRGPGVTLGAVGELPLADGLVLCPRVGGSAEFGAAGRALSADFGLALGWVRPVLRGLLSARLELASALPGALDNLSAGLALSYGRHSVFQLGELEFKRGPSGVVNPWERGE